ncbi:unnamed protein product, partial [Linum tenue]
MDTAAPGTRHTCVKLEIYTPASEPVFVKGTWFEGRFDLSITEGLHSWVCHAREEDARDRAAQWVSQYPSISNWRRSTWGFKSLARSRGSTMPAMAANELNFANVYTWCNQCQMLLLSYCEPAT